jgi:hypothetical protein
MATGLTVGQQDRVSRPGLRRAKLEASRRLECPQAAVRRLAVGTQVQSVRCLDAATREQTVDRGWLGLWPSEAAAILARSILIGYLPCRECGALLSSEQRSRHVCRPEDFVVHQVTKARVQLTAFENEVAQFLETSAGKFALFLAKRQRNPWSAA